ncbi:hypothetical protein G7Y31_01145 [Corynebacterium lizhenjunii]|uniref:Uncharacterized protein n=1 Tax=Corynebacterium lizhenjunii TaxID=2709394 RepID=A0A7T0KFX0_9CORY|nr:hypothetical protein [Corynebacterium lizhenjunii]QPK79359.1 hypothetical protein G7Y31_01145 [Corynebacterium lizhenjunii]
MAGDAYEVLLTSTARKDLDKRLRKSPAKKDKVAKAVKRMREFGPTYPSFNTHQEKRTSRADDPTYISYVEHNTHGAWRMYWKYAQDKIVVLYIGPHP